MNIKEKHQKELIKDIVEWDIENWWRAIKFWEDALQISDIKGKSVLDVGGRNGGVSLYWSLKGAEVICSDINESSLENARKLHRKYGVEKSIKYEMIDATNIPYESSFDIICFKSVLGGVGCNGNFDNQKKMMNSIYRALKKNGQLCFCENLSASPLHQYTRRRFIDWGEKWRYINMDEVTELTEKFSNVETESFGFLGVFGRTRWLSTALGKMDTFIDSHIKKEYRYIVSCVCEK